MNRKSINPSKNIFFVAKKYCWVYTFNMYKKPLVIFSLLRIISIIVLISWLIASFFRIEEYGVIDALANTFIPFAYIIIALIAVSIVMYYMYAIFLGGNYHIIYELNSEGINHMKISQSSKKAKLFSSVQDMISSFAINDNVNENKMAKDIDYQIYTQFCDLKKVIVYRRKATVKLISKGRRVNYVYTDKDDIEFVMNYIIDRCPRKAKTMVL